MLNKSEIRSPCAATAEAPPPLEKSSALAHSELAAAGDDRTPSEGTRANGPLTPAQSGNGTSGPLTPSQWLPKPATSQSPDEGPALRATWSPSEGAREICGTAVRNGGPGPRPSSLSILQRLPRERQEELFGYSDTHSHKDTVQWLAEAGVKTSDSSIGRFRRWFYRRRQHEENVELTKGMIELRRKNEPNISEEELAVFGRKVFTRLAIDTEDAPEWARQQLVRQREIRLELEQARIRLARQKFEFDAAKACVKHYPQIRLVMNNSGLSEPEKIERVHGALFPKAPVMPNDQCQMTKECPIPKAQ